MQLSDAYDFSVYIMCFFFIAMDNVSDSTFINQLFIKLYAQCAPVTLIIVLHLKFR